MTLRKLLRYVTVSAIATGVGTIPSFELVSVPGP
jgi:hypothetical protein